MPPVKKTLKKLTKRSPMPPKDSRGRFLPRKPAANADPAYVPENQKKSNPIPIPEKRHNTRSQGLNPHIPADIAFLRDY